MANPDIAVDHPLEIEDVHSIQTIVAMSAAIEAIMRETVADKDGNDDPAHVAAVVIVPEAVVSHVPVAIGHDHSRAPVHGADRIVHVPIRKAHDPTEVGPSREILVKSSNVDQTAVAPASHRRDPIHNLHPDHHQSHIPAMEMTISGSHRKYDPHIHKLDEDEAIRQHHFASSGVYFF